MDSVIALADLQSIYSVAEVDRAAEDGAARRNEGLKSWYDRMRELGGSRYIIKPSTAAAVDELHETSPNFANVVDDLRKYLALAIAGNEAVQFTPLLLLGEPGLGKTYFAKKLAQALGTGFEFVSMGSLTAGWIQPAHRRGGNAAGQVAHTLIDGDLPIRSSCSTGSTNRRRFALRPDRARCIRCSGDTAAHFKDEFIDVDMDASHILWIATANDESMIPEPILNRMNVYAIDRPDAAGARTIALAVYHEILDAHRWPFPPEPTESVLERLAAVPARDMRKLLLDAFGTAQLANRDYLVPEDIDAKKLCGRKARVGF
jgi:ATP-dependent Lon protease